MRLQTIQTNYMGGRLKLVASTATEDTYADVVTYPIVGNKEGFYHFNPDIYTVTEASLILVEAILKKNCKEVDRLLNDQAKLKRYQTKENPVNLTKTDLQNLQLILSSLDDGSELYSSLEDAVRVYESYLAGELRSTAYDY
jgi:hypothetical protein